MADDRLARPGAARPVPRANCSLRLLAADLGYSLNFRLPAKLTATGTLWLRMGKVRRTTGTPLPSLAHVPVRTVTFRPAVPLRLRLAGCDTRWAPRP